VAVAFRLTVEACHVAELLSRADGFTAPFYVNLRAIAFQ
jgi:hypothetical protein